MTEKPKKLTSWPVDETDWRTLALPVSGKLEPKGAREMPNPGKLNGVRTININKRKRRKDPGL